VEDGAKLVVASGAQTVVVRSKGKVSCDLPYLPV